MDMDITRVGNEINTRLGIYFVTDAKKPALGGLHIAKAGKRLGFGSPVVPKEQDSYSYGVDT